MMPASNFCLTFATACPRARQKRLILRARSPEICFLEDPEAEILIDALGLKEA